MGLAVSDPSQLLATPLSVLVRGESQNPIAERVATVAHEEQAVGVIVGLPLNEDGSEGRQAHRARHFAAMVEKSSHLPVVLSDERFSTIEAASVQKSQGRRRRQGKGKQEGYLDALAAALILQRFLDQNHPPSMLSAEEAR